MKKPIISILSLLIFAFSRSTMQAQQPSVAFDTLHLDRIDQRFGEYSLPGTRINKIGYVISRPEITKDIHYSTGGNIGRGALALVTGIGVGGTKEVDWWLPGTIWTNDTSYNWLADVYCPGSLEKISNRVKNEDGSSSVEVTYQNNYYWNKGAIGFIIESGDTIGRYYIVNETRANPNLHKWLMEVYKEQIEHEQGFAGSQKEFAFYGEFLGKESAILYNADENRFYMFEGVNLSGIYQPDKLQQFVRKRKRVHPYLLVKETLTENERNDVLMLAMLGQCLKEMMYTSSY